jgi:hypothetical protein
MLVLVVFLCFLSACSYQAPRQFYADRAQCSAIGGQAQSGTRSLFGHAIGEMAYQDCMYGRGW